MAQTDAYPRLVVLPQSNYLQSLMTIIRNEKTGCPEFVTAFDKVCQQLLPAAFNLLPYDSVQVKTPTGSNFLGSQLNTPVCGVSILRAGASMETPLRNASLSQLSYGKILIQRDEATCLPEEIYCKLPKNIGTKRVFLLEPMLATGGSACKALEILKRNGVQEENIIFLNLVTSKKGLDRVTKEFPGINLVTAAVDQDLTASSHIAPGLGDFGDRYYGTTE